MERSCTALLRTGSAESESRKRSSNQPSHRILVQSVLVSRLDEYNSSVCKAGALKQPTKYGFVVSNNELKHRNFCEAFAWRRTNEKRNHKEVELCPNSETTQTGEMS